MNIFDSIKTVASSIMLMVVSLFTPTSTIVTPYVNQQVTIPTISPQILDTPTSTPSSTSTPHITRFVSPSLSATPTPSQDIINKCTQLSNQRKYFEGVLCLPSELQNNPDSKQPKPASDNTIERLQLLVNINSDLVDRMVNICINIGPTVYEHCNGSLAANADRLRDQILSQNPTDLQECMNKIAVGDDKGRNTAKDYYWKAKMKEQMSSIYSHCSKNDGNLDTYNF
jgi:hypothetical protein